MNLRNCFVGGILLLLVIVLGQVTLNGMDKLVAAVVDDNMKEFDGKSESTNENAIEDNILHEVNDTVSEEDVTVEQVVERVVKESLKRGIGRAEQ